ncbi:MAG: SGNH/GDSL hydrolase family protein, partial [Planctomycetota bacterium]
VDERGLRRTVAAPRPGAPRVFFLGGSTMWGTGARDEGTIPSLVARRTGWRVRNYGEAGYVSTQERFLLELELQRGERPDVVVLYDGVNDVFAAYQTRRGGLPQNEGFREAEFNLSKSPRRLVRATLAAGLRESATLAIARRAVGSGATPPPLSDAERDRVADEVARAYARNVEDLVALGRARGFRVACFLQPVIFTKRVLAPDEVPLERGHAWVRELYLAAYDRIRALALPSWHDLSDVFADDPAPRFFDFCHISEGANDVVARKVVETLEAP